MRQRFFPHLDLAPRVFLLAGFEKGNKTTLDTESWVSLLESCSTAKLLVHVHNGDFRLDGTSGNLCFHPRTPLKKLRAGGLFCNLLVKKLQFSVQKLIIFAAFRGKNSSSLALCFRENPDTFQPSRSYPGEDFY